MGLHFLHGRFLNLANTFGRNVVLSCQVMQGGFFFREPALLQDILAALVQGLQGRVQAGLLILGRIFLLQGVSWFHTHVRKIGDRGGNG